MLTKEDNELMCRVGPGTGMGDAMRRYWLPALLSSDVLAADADPKRVQLLGEKFVAFRDTDGRVGILDETCCHRGASLTLGRVEGCGIRCIYHGWKFAVDGTVMETPNVSDPTFKTRFKAKAYPVREAGGLVWVYLGPAELEPPFPAWGWLGLPEAHRLATAHVMECNFVQIIEGLVDSTHLGILHADGLSRSNASDLSFAQKVNTMQFDLMPRLEVEDTDFGFHYVALRSVTKDGVAKTEARVAAFALPCIVFNPNGDVITIVVPVDDTRSIFYHVFWDAQRKINEEPLKSQHLKFIGLDQETLSQFGVTWATIDSPDKPSLENGYRQDRAAMRRGERFSGLPGLIQEDIAVSVSAGPVRDRTKEILSTADVAVMRLYRALLNAARAAKKGEAPLGTAAAVDTAQIVGANGVLEPGTAWQSLVPGHKAVEMPLARSA
jgi:phenylpropionate dioxygenase-like ring-hydroxylating dioxygenase large terminal subunit